MQRSFGDEDGRQQRANGYADEGGDPQAAQLPRERGHMKVTLLLRPPCMQTHTVDTKSTNYY
jgi:hypothetical protein